MLRRNLSACRTISGKTVPLIVAVTWNTSLEWPLDKQQVMANLHDGQDGMTDRLIWLFLHAFGHYPDKRWRSARGYARMIPSVSIKERTS